MLPEIRIACDGRDASWCRCVVVPNSRVRLRGLADPVVGHGHTGEVAGCGEAVKRVVEPPPVHVGVVEYPSNGRYFTMRSVLVTDAPRHPYANLFS